MSNRLLVPERQRLLLPRRRLYAPALIVPGITPMPVFPVSGPVVTPSVTTYDTGSGSFTVPAYNTLTIELWGGGAHGGLTGGNQATASTCSTYSLSAGGGKAPTASNVGQAGTYGLGGTASGGNTENTNGGNGADANPVSAASAGTSGKGGDAPHGGTGGAAVPSTTGSPNNANPGNAPGGGGGGGCSFAISSYYKYPGGGSGAYVKHVLTAGSGPSIGALIAWAVGAGATGAGVMYGNGAAGRVRFTVA